MPIILPDYQTDNLNKKEKTRKKLVSFLNKHKVTNGNLSTHTSWGWEIGKYYFDEKDLKKLYKYYANVIKNGLPGDTPITLTEKPKEYSPIYVDIDFKTSKDKHTVTDGLLYDDSLLTQIVSLYQEAINYYLDVENDKKICCVFEKEGLEDKHPHWGNGIHLLFPNIIARENIRYLIRDYVVKKTVEKKLFEKYDNPSSDIIDISVVSRNNIMIYGAKKPDSKYYYNYTKLFNGNCEEIDCDDIFSSSSPSYLDYVKAFSLRRKVHNQENETVLNKKYNEKKIDLEFKSLGITGDSVKDYNNMAVTGKVEDVSEARVLVDMLKSERATDYHSWIRVGWALYNTDSTLLDAFNEFSRRGDEIKKGVYKGEYDIKNYWSKMKKKNLTIYSLRHWAKEDSPLEYERYKQSRFIKNAHESLEGKDYQIAKTFYEKYKDRFVCSNIEGRHEWWEFKSSKHRWVRNPGGFTIQRILPEEFANEWSILADEVNEKFRSASGAERNEYLRQHESIRKIITQLYSNSYRKNIMENLANLFYDPKFNEKLDEVNKHLICFENGVFDLEKGKLRQGRPDDYISMSTNINKIPFNPSSKESKEIREFFEKVLPNKKVRDYFHRALCSCLHGRNKDQKLFICTGCGSNGKSVTFDLVNESFGDYYQAPRIELLTRKSQGQGQANEDLVNIKGKRCGVFQEPDQNETFNASIMKQLTAGNDTITARRNYSSNISFIPQMKYFMACNDKPDVKDNTDGTWRRLRVIKFGSRFVNKPLEQCRLDKHEYPIDDTIGNKKEDWAPHLVAYLIHLYISDYNINGLAEPDEVKFSTNRYKSENDHYTQFFDDQIEIIKSKDKIRVTQLWKRMQSWYQENNLKKLTDKKHKLIEFFNHKLDQKGGKGYYTGIQFKNTDEDDEDEEVSKEANILNV